MKKTTPQSPLTTSSHSLADSGQHEFNNAFFNSTNRFLEFEGFCLIVELGTISQAAAEMGLTHSTLSVKIKSLEEGLGIKLLHRDGPKITITEEGKCFYDYIMPIMDGLKSIHAAFLDRRNTV
jgi:hypothetical protein